MQLSNVWGYGQLFGYSALDGKNYYDNDFVATLTSKALCLRFELSSPVFIEFNTAGSVEFSAVMSDFICASDNVGEYFITFLNADTLVGYAPVPVNVKLEGKYVISQSGGVVSYKTQDGVISVLNKDGAFAVNYSNSVRPCPDMNTCVSYDFDELKKERYAYYNALQECPLKQYERLYYKALAINKVNVRSAEGKIPFTWTTPDRVPHRNMWLWDSVFHALSLCLYNVPAAESAIKAVLSQMRQDGFIPHMMTPYSSTNITQPCVLSYGVWEVYKHSGNKEFLSFCAPYLTKYLRWDKLNRDKKGNGLLEWFTEPDVKICRCGESGMDNSLRFDIDDDIYAVDFSVFYALDCLNLSYVYAELENFAEAEKCKKEYERSARAINNVLWCEQDGVYYDRSFKGEFTHALTPVSFLPLFAGIASKDRAERAVKALTDKSLLWTELPVASVSRNAPDYSTDMWRGATWINYNYFIYKGLLNYGYNDIAQELKEKTLQAINFWYQKTGSIFEFYDSKNKTSPFFCLRKGEPVDPPDWRKHVHSISDYNWSACFTLLFLEDSRHK